MIFLQVEIAFRVLHLRSAAQIRARIATNAVERTLARLESQRLSKLVGVS